MESRSLMGHDGRRELGLRKWLLFMVTICTISSRFVELGTVVPRCEAQLAGILYST